MENFLNTYKELSAKNLHQLADIYTEDIMFVDPAHQIQGLVQLTDYFNSLYQNIDSIGFQFCHHLRSADEGYVQWVMNFSHPRMNKGNRIEVAGASYLRFADSDKVRFHQDYFDLGAMLYEQLPFLGKLITNIKRRLGS